MSDVGKGTYSARTQALQERLNKRFADQLESSALYVGDLTIEIQPKNLLEIMTALRDDAAFLFTQMIDLCGVDYATYGQVEWETENAPNEGFGRACLQEDVAVSAQERQFAVVYHLLSIALNVRLRVKVFVDNDDLMIHSVVSVWPGANWFEREAFDLFGILFEGHPDLRRILTDYGFIGHPFRKDFPLIGHVEMRYDEAKERVVYEPVSIKPRVLVPKVIRNDHRYIDAVEQGDQDV